MVEVTVVGVVVVVVVLVLVLLVLVLDVAIALSGEVDCSHAVMNSVAAIKVIVRWFVFISILPY